MSNVKIGAEIEKMVQLSKTLYGRKVLTQDEFCNIHVEREGMAKEVEAKAGIECYALTQLFGALYGHKGLDPQASAERVIEVLQLLDWEVEY